MTTFYRIILIIPLFLIYTYEDNKQKYFDLLFEATFKNNFAAGWLDNSINIASVLH